MNTPKIGNPTKNHLRTLLLVTGLAILNYIYLTYGHYQLHLGLMSEKSFCSINSFLDCDATSASPYSKFFGIPVAILGLMSQIALLMILFQAYVSETAEELRRRLFYGYLLSGLALLASLLMAWISLTRLGTLCLFCSFSYLFSLIQFALLSLSKAKSWKNTKTDLRNLFVSGESGNRGTLILLACVPLGAWLTNFVIMESYAKGLERFLEESVTEWRASPKVEFSIGESIHLGAPAEKAVMTIVEFADFRCIHCKMAAPVLHSFVKSRSDVRLIFQSYPLDGQCNSAIPESGDGTRCILAKTAFCAHGLGKGIEAHDWIFENSESVNKNGFAQISADLQIDENKMKECIESPQTQTEILSQATRGTTAKVAGTPAIFVNGQLLPRGHFLPVLERVHETLQSNKTH